VIHPYVIVLLLACITAATIASAIVCRDPDQRANRLLGLILSCAAFWSLCEVLANTSQDPEQVVWMIRFSALGWVPMGPLALHFLTVLEGEPRSLPRRLLPYSYAAAALGIVLYLATAWCITGAVKTDWGWGIRFGPLFWAAYLPTMLSTSVVLNRWPIFFSQNVSPGERRLALWMFAGLAVPMVVASVTDVLLPHLGHDVPRLGSISLLLFGAVVGWSVRHNGYFLLAPGAFANEILESLRDGVALLHDDGRIRMGNGALARLAGRSPVALAGTPVREILPQVASAPPSEPISGREIELVDAAGQRIPVAVSGAPLRDEQGEALGQVLTVLDLREISALRSRLVTSGRLAAVGELAAGIAHEINNPVTYVRSNLVHLHQLWNELAEAAEKAGCESDLEALIAEGEELIEESVEGVDRVSAIVRDVRAFSHAGVGRRELADVNELLDNTANVASLRYAVSVERCFGELPPLLCAPHQLRQVFLNLLFNGLQAVAEGGRLRIVTQFFRGWITVRIQDDGCGIPGDVIDRIFDPFFTTRPVGEGTGLGLSLSYQIVRNHGGEIEAESEPGEGTTVIVRLPVVDPQEVPDEAPILGGANGEPGPSPGALVPSGAT
jgi:PAS domain S-box-containing protein